MTPTRAKTRTGVGSGKVAKWQSPGTDETGKLSCHSDYVDPEAARTMQEQRLGEGVLVPLDVRPALGIGKEDRLV